MDTVDNTVFTTTILPISNEFRLGGSILPDRFVSSSESARIAGLGTELGSSIQLNRLIRDVIVPVTVV